MVARLLLICLLVAPTFAAQAETQKETRPKQSAPDNGLGVTSKALQDGLQRFIKEEADCRAVNFEKVRTFKKGTVIRQKLEREGARLDMSLSISKAGTVSSARFAAPTKDPAHLTVMLCATYAAMRTLQPKGQGPEAARKAALELWQGAQQKPLARSFGGQTFKAQMAPFELNAF
jgi:hypothetical protein